MYQLNDKQLKWLLLLLNDRVWCNANQSSERVISRVLTDRCYTVQDRRTFNNHIVPRYIEYKKVR